MLSLSYRDYPWLAVNFSQKGSYFDAKSPQIGKKMLPARRSWRF
jgi:hypothetical protein